MLRWGVDTSAAGFAYLTRTAVVALSEVPPPSVAFGSKLQ